MIHHLALFKLNPEISAEELDSITRQTRAQLLKIDEVLVLRCGRNIDPASEWAFFIAVEVESTEKLELYKENAVYIKHLERVLKPNTREHFELSFEMEPGKDVRFS
ncbi:MAG: Dabb family protein [Chthoniobacteraceae bacterium]